MARITVSNTFLLIVVVVNFVSPFLSVLADKDNAYENYEEPNHQNRSNSSHAINHKDPIPHYSHQTSHNKHSIQGILTQRDIENSANKEWYRAHFPEILGGIAVLVLAVAFLCWFKWSQKKYGPMTIPTDENGVPYRYTKQGRYSVGKSGFYTAKGNTNIAPVLEGPSLILKQGKQQGLKCSKPACVCGPEGGGGVRMGDRSGGWSHRTVDESYGPASSA